MNPVIAFDNSLNAQIRLIRALVDCLMNEREAVESRNLKGLQQAIECKLGLFSELEKADAELKAQLKSLGYEGEIADVYGWLDARSPRTAGLWQQFLDALAQCREDNERNGQLIDSMRHFYNEALAIFTRRDAPMSAGYSARGRSLDTSTRNDLGTA